MENIYLKRITVTIILLLAFSFYTIYSQEDLLSAKEVLQKLSSTFKMRVKDYKADIKWIIGEKVQSGNLYFKNPQKMRIDFIDPPGQVICTNGLELWLYIDYLKMTLHQQLLEKEKIKKDDGTTETKANPILMDAVGLDKFVNDYAAEYNETKEKVNYKDGKKVYQLKLIRWRSSKNGFNLVYLTVQEDGLIRKVEGITAQYRHIILEIDNYQINKNLSDLFFNYQPPAHTNTVENFITEQEEVR